ncbi:hypothetical protein [Neisseria meningitidis]|nr:hypothetical protein [Neisseria meningitidis]
MPSEASGGGSRLKDEKRETLPLQSVKIKARKQTDSTAGNRL